jgi:hypothetical protein
MKSSKNSSGREERLPAPGHTTQVRNQQGHRAAGNQRNDNGGGQMAYIKAGARCNKVQFKAVYIQKYLCMISDTCEFS